MYDKVISDNTTYSSPYSGLLDSLLDYPTWYTLTGAFKSSAGNLSALMETVLATQSTYTRGAFGTGSFLENHDQPRFQSFCNDTSVSGDLGCAVITFVDSDPDSLS